MVLSKHKNSPPADPDYTTKQPGVDLIWICMDVSYLLCTCTERTNMYCVISQGQSVTIIETRCNRDIGIYMQYCSALLLHSLA